MVVRKWSVAFVLLAVCLVGGCVGRSAPTATATAVPPLVTPTSAPTATPTPTPTATVVPTQTATAEASAEATAASSTDEPTPAPLPTTTPLPLFFAPGTTSARATGELPAKGIASYVVRAEANQVLEVHVDPRGGVQLAVYDPDGRAIKGADDMPFFRGHTARSGDYTLVIQAGDQPTFYMMRVV